MQFLVVIRAGRFIFETLKEDFGECKMYVTLRKKGFIGVLYM